jgi:hypothetical protein
VPVGGIFWRQDIIDHVSLGRKIRLFRLLRGGELYRRELWN